MASSWQDKAKAKKDSILALIPEEWRLPTVPLPNEQLDVTGQYIEQFLSPQEIEITETDAVGIAERTSNGAWRAVDVTRAFCHRAALAHQLLNCLHEIFFDDAIAHARKLDEDFEKTRKPVGPLHGVPVSLKDQFHVKGVETSMGYVGWIGTFQGQTGTGKEKIFESQMVQELRALGAVLFCKTSVPHTLMLGETINNIIGYTWNPKNRNLSAGGSSGGEGALIGLRGSPLGFGTDIGGSIRIPASFNGLFGIRPSTGRLPYEGMANSMDGQNSVLSVVGPLATSAQALRLAFKSLLSQKPWFNDPHVHEIPWRSEEEQWILDLIAGRPGKLALGLLKHDGVVAVHPPVARALEIAARRMREMGHDVIEWEPPSHKDLVEAALVAWRFDAGADVNKDFALSGEPQVIQTKTILNGTGERADAVKIAKTNVHIRELRKGYMDYWNSSQLKTSTGRPVDAIIAPCAPFAAARPEGYLYYGYTSFVNLLDYSAAVVPITHVDKDIDKALTDFKPVSDLDRDVQSLYDANIYHGAHVSLQVVARRLQEEKIMAIGALIADAIGSP